ncbi:acetyltransferase [Echinicola marina]|uniref:acetyltransferase n=1 Tax=Echinicola marina TaxID=2859768 RepID=UPI001CF63477|nr:acetyltransferase [Echinicola marina]UCS93249.1 acetyltransferase [Echinicola marina]
MLDKIAIIGYSGHGLVVVDAAMEAGMKITHYCESEIKSSNPFGLEYLGDDQKDDFQGWEVDYAFLLGVGNNKIRKIIAERVISRKKQLPNVIHPQSSISKHIEIGCGNFISKNVAINPLASIGDYCLLNTGCIIEHEVRLGEAVHIGPGAVLTGGVHVGDLSFIGANAVVKQGVKIGSNVIVGAGTVVINDIPDNATVIGNPGKIYERK